jgi:hypothetical protein
MIGGGTSQKNVADSLFVDEDDDEHMCGFCSQIIFGLNGFTV